MTELTQLRDYCEFLDEVQGEIDVTTMVSEVRPTPAPLLSGRQRSPRPGWLVAVAAFAVVLVAGVAALMLRAGSGEVAPLTDPLDVAQAYEAAEDIDAALALVADDAVYRIGISTFTGHEEIREWMEAMAGSRGPGVSVQTSEYRVDGNTVSWHVVLEFPNDLGTVAENVTVVVEDGLIQSFTSR